MGRLATFAVSAGVISMIAVTVHAAPRGGFFAPGVAPQAPEVMIYFSHSMGTGATARPTFGLRVQQVRQGGNSGDPEGGDVMHRRELLNWQMEAHSNFRLADVRVRLGHRLTYDLTNRRFGAPGAPSAMQIGTPALRTNLLGQSAPPPAVPSQHPVQVTPRPTSFAAREFAVAAMATLAPARISIGRHQVKSVVRDPSRIVPHP